jgi:TfoX/Sxy family transcriptional regulator of competence genes
MDELLERVRDLLPDAEERRMFGGVGFMRGGHLVCSVSRRGLLVRLGEPALAKAVTRPGVAPMVMAGRTSKGWARVDADVVADEAALRDWVSRAETFVAGLPPKR